jgi:hypothetical protein
MKFFTRKANKALRTAKGSQAFDRLCKLYREHLKRIRPDLSRGWRKVAGAEFHDTEVFSFGRLHDADEFIINLDMNPRWKQPPLFICALHFYRVRRVDLASRVQGDVILNDEVHTTHTGATEWRVLLRHSEFRIQADDVSYFINHEPLA